MDTTNRRGVGIQSDTNVAEAAMASSIDRILANGGGQDCRADGNARRFRSRLASEVPLFSPLPTYVHAVVLHDVTRDSTALQRPARVVNIEAGEGAPAAGRDA